MEKPRTGNGNVHFEDQGVGSAPHEQTKLANEWYILKKHMSEMCAL